MRTTLLNIYIYIYIYIEEISTYVSMCKVYVIYIYDWPQAAAPFLSLQTRLCEVGVGAPQLQDDYVTCVRLPPRRPPKDKQQDEKSARYVIHSSQTPTVEAKLLLEQSNHRVNCCWRSKCA